MHKVGTATSVKEIVERNVGMPAREFLHPVEKPYIHGIAEAIKIIKEHCGPIAIIGDYDSDGINATVIMYRGLTRYGFADVRTRVPLRFTEGYGLSESIVDETAEWLEMKLKEFWDVFMFLLGNIHLMGDKSLFPEMTEKDIK